MPKKQAHPSKLTRPRLRKSVARGNASVGLHQAQPVTARDVAALIDTTWRAVNDRRARSPDRTQANSPAAEALVGARELGAPLEVLEALVKLQRVCSAPVQVVEKNGDDERQLSTILIRLVSANMLIDSGDLDLAEELLKRATGVTPTRIVEDAVQWPIKIYTLGHFDVLLHDKRPEFSRKVPRKVLSLLKAIVAFGGRDVAEPRIIDALWPDHEGDTACHALTTTLHRLRTVLGETGAVVQSGGELSLDERLCWTDAHAFESLIERSNGDPKELEKSLALYRGTFLPQEENTSWAAPMRERLRAKFTHAVGTCGSALEATCQFETAIDLYTRGIDADDLVEPFYQGLMRCYVGLDRRTEAVSVYRRLRETLSITLGISPSSATQRLYEALRLN